VCDTSHTAVGPRADSGYPVPGSLNWVGGGWGNTTVRSTACGFMLEQIDHGCIATFTVQTFKKFVCEARWLLRSEIQSPTCPVAIGGSAPRLHPSHGTAAKHRAAYLKRTTDERDVMKRSWVPEWTVYCTHLCFVCSPDPTPLPPPWTDESSVENEVAERKRVRFAVYHASATAIDFDWRFVQGWVSYPAMDARAHSFQLILQDRGPRIAT